MADPKKSTIVASKNNLFVKAKVFKWSPAWNQGAQACPSVSPEFFEARGIDISLGITCFRFGTKGSNHRIWWDQGVEKCASVSPIGAKKPKGVHRYHPSSSNSSNRGAQQPPSVSAFICLAMYFHFFALNSLDHLSKGNSFSSPHIVCGTMGPNISIGITCVHTHQHKNLN